MIFIDYLQYTRHNMSTLKSALKHRALCPLQPEESGLRLEPDGAGICLAATQMADAREQKEGKKTERRQKEERSKHDGFNRPNRPARICSCADS